MGTKWMEYKPEHLSYFSKATLRRLFESTGFDAIRAFPARKTLSFDYINGHFEHYPVQPYSAILSGIRRMTPKAVRRMPIRITASGIVVIARKA